MIKFLRKVIDRRKMSIPDWQMDTLLQHVSDIKRICMESELESQVMAELRKTNNQLVAEKATYSKALNNMSLELQRVRSGLVDESNMIKVLNEQIEEYIVCMRNVVAVLKKHGDIKRTAMYRKFKDIFDEAMEV